MKRFLVMIIDNKKVVLSRQINYNVSFHMHSDLLGMTGESIFPKYLKNNVNIFNTFRKNLLNCRDYF